MEQTTLAPHPFRRRPQYQSAANPETPEPQDDGSVKRGTIIPTFGYYTLRFIDRFRDGKAGDEVTEKQLSALCDDQPVAIGERRYANVLSAIKYCRRIHRVVWARVRGGGRWRCLGTDEILAGAQADLRSVRRRSGQGIYALMAVKSDGLSEEQQLRHHALTAQLAATAIMTHESTTKKLEARNVDLSPDPRRLLDAMTRVATTM